MQQIGNTVEITWSYTLRQQNEIIVAAFCDKKKLKHLHIIATINEHQLKH